MLLRRLVLAACLCLAVASLAWAQRTLPRVAVIPLNPVGVSKADATAFTGLLEVALVKTEVFDVLEQGQVNVILDAQERSVADCTDEKCAIEFGKLLSAEQIVLGSISTTGGQYFLSAKVIDVTTGRSVRADTVDAGSVKDLTGVVELLAFKLAGLTFKTGGQEQVARAFSEVFVETVPDGAEVLLNGVVKGKSPLLLERVPVGKVTIEARREALYAIRDVEVSADTLAKLKLELAVSLGNVFIKSPVREGIRVLLDGKDSGDLGAGLKEGLPAGEHQLLLRGGGYYWEGLVTVQTGKTVSVEAYPREVGILEYTIPEGAQAELVSKDARIVLRGSGKLENVYAQSYTVRVSGTDYESLDGTWTVSRGQTARVAPTLKRPESYRRSALYSELSATVQAMAKLAAAGRAVSASDVREAEALEAKLASVEFRFADLVDRAKALRVALASRLEKQAADDARAGFVRRLSELESLRSAGRDVVEADVTAAEGLSAEIAASSLASEELRVRGRTLVHDLKVRSLEDRKKALEARLSAVTRSRRGLLAAGGVTLALGAAAGGLGGTSYVLGQGAYADYLAAGDASAAVAAWARVSTFGTLLNVGIVGGSVGLGLGSILLLATPKPGTLAQQIQAVERDLAALQSQGR